MQSYRDIDGDSGVKAYESGRDFIKVEFEDCSIYLYTYRSSGSQHIETMKDLAVKGDGLNAYISKEKPEYESKE